MLRIGLTQRVEEIPNRNERRDCLDQRWAELLVKLGYLAIPLPNLALPPTELLDCLALDGVIITGGNDLCNVEGGSNFAPERDSLEHELLDVCASRDVPVLGVCRGLQLMVTHYGGELASVEGHVATPHAIALSSSCPAPIGDRELVNSYHNFGVTEQRLPKSLQPLATASDGTIEAIAHRKHLQWAIMWHPERPPFDSQDHALIEALFSRKTT